MPGYCCFAINTKHSGKDNSTSQKDTVLKKLFRKMTIWRFFWGSTPERQGTQHRQQQQREEASAEVDSPPSYSSSCSQSVAPGGIQINHTENNGTGNVRQIYISGAGGIQINDTTTSASSPSVLSTGGIQINHTGTRFQYVESASESSDSEDFEDFEDVQNDTTETLVFRSKKPASDVDPDWKQENEKPKNGGEEKQNNKAYPEPSVRSSTIRQSTIDGRTVNTDVGSSSQNRVHIQNTGTGVVIDVADGDDKDKKPGSSKRSTKNKANGSRNNRFGSQNFSTGTIQNNISGNGIQINGRAFDCFDRFGDNFKSGSVQNSTSVLQMNGAVFGEPTEFSRGGIYTQNFNMGTIQNNGYGNVVQMNGAVFNGSMEIGRDGNRFG